MSDSDWLCGTCEFCVDLRHLIPAPRPALWVCLVVNQSQRAPSGQSSIPAGISP